MCKLGRLRQLDYELRDLQTNVLANVNALAETDQKTLPVCGTLSHFLDHVGAPALAGFRTKMIRRLIRNKVLDRYRVLGALVIAIDGTGQVSFDRRHCPHCLTQTHNGRTYYYHNVLEAKLITSSGLALSVGTEFIDNRHFDNTPNGGLEKRKQDCELKAFARLARQLKRDFPQTRLCIAADGLYACGPVMSICRKNGWKYMLTFKPGRLPAAWEEFQSLLAQCPDQVRRKSFSDGKTIEVRWVRDMTHTDVDNIDHTFHAIQCIETDGDQITTFAWITNLDVTKDNVLDIVQYAGRDRWKIENAGFNSRQERRLRTRARVRLYRRAAQVLLLPSANRTRRRPSLAASSCSLWNKGAS